MSNNNKEFTAKDIRVDKGFESLRMLRSRIREGTFGEILDDWRWIFSYTARHKWAVLFYLVLGMLGTGMGQLSSYLNIPIVNIITQKQGDRLWFLIVVSVGSMLVSLFLNNYLGRISMRIGIDINNDIQADIFTKIMDADWLSISRYNSGDVLNRFNNDVSTVAGNAIGWIPNVVLTLMNFGITLVIMWNIDYVVALMAFLSAPFTLLASRVVVKKQREYGKKVREMSSHVMDFEVESFYNMDTIKSFGIADRYDDNLRWWQRRFRNMQLDYNLFTIKTNIYLSLVGYAVSSACFFYCLYRMWNGAISYGEMTYILAQRGALSGAFSSLISIVPSFLNSSISAHRIRELVDLPRELHIPASGKMDRYIDGGFRIRMDGVNFAYAENDRVITESDFRADPGEIVALVGPSGEGKTTMIRLILGLLRPDTGHVYLEAARKYPAEVVEGKVASEAGEAAGELAVGKAAEGAGVVGMVSEAAGVAAGGGSGDSAVGKAGEVAGGGSGDSAVGKAAEAAGGGNGDSAAEKAAEAAAAAAGKKSPYVRPRVEMNTDTRHLFAYVPQGNTILSGTVAENLRMVSPDATDDQVVEALKLACAWDFIKDLPEGINTPIGERGRGFSEGQSQRIAIARAMLRDSPILLLDEATSALDVTTERQVLRNIVQQRPNKTVIVTTHRPSVLNLCQRVYRVMDTKVTQLSEEESSRMAMDF